MNKLKHTPGPWNYQENTDNYTHIVRYGKGQTFLCQLSQISTGESEANARLIAAAPEMLDDIIKDIKVYSGITWDIKNLKSDMTYFINNKSFDNNALSGFKRCLEKIDLIEKVTSLKIEEIINE